MAPSNSITEGDVRALATEQSFDRGYRYFRNGSVFDVIRRGNLVTAKVEGSAFEPYRVQVTVSDAGIAATSCTCPYDGGGICKHVVATLLVVMHEPETIAEKPTLTALLADLTADQLRQVLMGIAEEGPAFAEAIEREVAWLQTQPATPVEQAGAAVPVDLNAVRRQIHRDFRQSSSSSSQYGYYDEYADPEVDPDLILLPHLEKVVALLDEWEVDTAVTLISTIVETYIDELTDLDEWVYEYNIDMFDQANLALGATLAEVLLSLDMKPDEREAWLDQVVDWQEALGDLEIAETAVGQSWSYAPLVRAMQGNITEKGAWEGEAPYYADELAQVRLHVLARRERTQEYINLAKAEGQIELAINMMAQRGDVDKAVAEAKAYLVYPGEILSLAQVLAAKGELAAALDVAEHGLSLEGEMDKIELARWTREQAVAAGNQPLALKAARTAFTSGYELASYTAVKQLAGDQWPALKPELLQALQDCWSVSRQPDVYLHENMMAEAMQAVDAQDFVYDHDLHRVIEATRETHPDWGVRKCKHKAESIMDAGQSGAYDTAVSWLRTARDIYQQHQRGREWESYLDTLLQRHKRKYKLVPMLRRIRA